MTPRPQQVLDRQKPTARGRSCAACIYSRSRCCPGYAGHLRGGATRRGAQSGARRRRRSNSSFGSRAAPHGWRRAGPPHGRDSSRRHRGVRRKRRSNSAPQDTSVMGTRGEERHNPATGKQRCAPAEGQRTFWCAVRPVSETKPVSKDAGTMLTWAPLATSVARRERRPRGGPAPLVASHKRCCAAREREQTAPPTVASHRRIRTVSAN